RVVNVSSGMGQLNGMNSGYVGYRVSKTAVNALTRILADEVRDLDILVNAVCPGWVKTRMGGENATRNPEEGADTIVWLATQPTGGVSGGFFRDRKPIEW
ncbi:SDR family NAD(P)-dependent oxidoreductase, partial [Limnoraphis robusta]